jgi:DNA invertase Pin-like site-specific DNA recombinase
MTTKGNKYLAYVRVSSHEQAERNISIPSQIEQIENYAKSN